MDMNNSQDNIQQTADVLQESDVAEGAEMTAVADDIFENEKAEISGDEYVPQPEAEEAEQPEVCDDETETETSAEFFADGVCTDDIVCIKGYNEPNGEVVDEPAAAEPVKQPFRITLTDQQRRLLLRAAAVLLMTFMVFFTAWLLPSSAQMNMGSQYSQSVDINAAVESGVANIASRSLQDIYELPEVYILPVSCDPAPEPNEANFSVEYNSKKRVEYGTYSDATISVTVWKENRDNTVYNFAEVKINHPTQFRTMFASGEYSTASRGETPLNMAKQSNAVVAISSDFCRYNQNGTLIIRGGNFYKHTPSGWEVLLVDDNGDFHFALDNEIELTTTSRGVEWDGKVIYNSFSFGPVLVRDGKAITDFTDVKAAIHGIYLTGDVIVARAAIGQLGELHYLLCTVDGNRGETFGVTLPQLARALEEKGCINAYNLDGGHSATLVFNDTLVNVPAAKDDTGAQRIQSDIIYFGTAIPNEE